MVRLTGRHYEAVHPHVRGDDASHACRRCSGTGSPPRAWGRHPRRRQRSALLRFTPTCVGTTTRLAGSDTVSRGSPPRAWGRLEGAPGLVLLRRFTPTCVGTTEGVAVKPNANTVHPHVRGDDDMATPIMGNAVGSPPRAWGRQRETVSNLLAVRFTPTCVGTTGAHGAGGCALPVHPHVRGDDGIEHGRRGDAVRFTPTCVGTTPGPGSWPACRAVHPHVRGDDTS